MKSSMIEPQKENEMNGPTRTHVFDQPTLPEFLVVWRSYGSPKRVEVSRELHRGFLTGPSSGDYRAWEEGLAERIIADDEMLGSSACYIRTPIEVPLGKFNEVDDWSPYQRKPHAEKPFPDMNEGVRANQTPVDRKVSTGKLQMNLVVSDLVRQAAAADTYGAEKYGEPGSWRNTPVEDVVRYVDAAERHLSDVKAALVEGKGDRWLAEDSKLAHLAHLAASVGILIEFAQRMGLALPEEFDRHWLRDPSDDRFAAKIAERELRGARIMSDVSGELAPDIMHGSKWSTPDAT
jgi:hypothetical protein